MNELRIIDESEKNNACIDELVEQFGKEQVFDKNKNNLNQNDYCKIFDILNKHIFKNNLKKIQINYFSFDKIIKTLKNNAVSIENLPENDIFAFYFVSYDIVHQSKSMNIKNEIIFLNKDNLQHMNFIYAVNVICHEMIHYYDRLFGEYETIVASEIKKRNSQNFHYTTTFLTKQRQAYNMRLYIIPYADPAKIEKLNKEAYDCLISEDNDLEKPLTIDEIAKNIKDKKHICITGKNTICIMMYD